MKKPKRIDNRKHRHKNFNYLLKKPKYKKKKGGQRMNHTRHDSNGKSTIRNEAEVFKPMVFKDFNYLLDGSQSLTDVDGQFEYNGNLFIIEGKSHYSSINSGQLISLFHTAYNTFKRGKIGQLTYRIDTGKKDEAGQDVFDYVVYGTEQFRQYEEGLEVVPFYELSKDNDWLARRLRSFQEACNFTWDSKLYLSNTLLRRSVNKVKKDLQAVRG